MGDRSITQVQLATCNGFTAADKSKILFISQIRFLEMDAPEAATAPQASLPLARLVARRAPGPMCPGPNRPGSK